ncbi:MAG: hypothetical protein AB7O66_15380 [Limisphaerales bacterium]
MIPRSPAPFGWTVPFHRADGCSFPRTSFLLIALLLLPAGTRASELLLDFSRLATGAPPETFRVGLTGGGPAPEWRVLQVAATPSLPPLLPTSPALATETVLAQVSEDTTDERFPLLIYTPEKFSDFTATLKFRTVKGRTERMAGLAFRLVDERNYYVVRASSLGNTFRFYKFVDGVRSAPIGPEIRIPDNEWQTLEVTCQGNQIRCKLNDRDAIPPLTDTSFMSGQLALWTKSDSVSHFASLRVTYEALKTLPQRLVTTALERYPRLLGITVFGEENGEVRAVASSDSEEVGQRATPEETRTLRTGTILAGTTRQRSTAIYPIRDRNGDPMFAVRLKMRTFAGQTDNNAAARALPIIQHLETVVGAADVSRQE